MADEQDRWLDRETAELLLRGESLEAVDADSREQAERLAKTLGALSVPPPLTGEELPGEAAALAAFRKARAEREGERAATGRSTDEQDPGAGLVRIGGRDGGARRSRWGRPLRFGLAAGLAACMAGGVAVAAGTGVLKVPFTSTAEPEPLAPGPSAATSDQPLVSPSPQETAEGGSVPGTATPGPSGGAGRDEARGGTPTERGSASDGGKAHSGDRWRDIASACRDVRDGKELNSLRKRALEGAAGGTSRVWTYCKGVLAESGGGAEGKDKGENGKGREASGGEDGRPGGSGKGGDGVGRYVPRAATTTPALPLNP
ncbi:hypothetical protein [Streptomyces sp. S.PNR 29]|uniref:hypothetical protein n=1 Tax=Streptomyces sp. S.PNR 29 TaxID=2973805 RepID=UPI0025AF0A59|nr:hypothetical protein [Streptomyces sp. S.PNR 29]MDN0195317.1 hypothetical protein [Streptomyces sp. S.PNR 29]